MSDAQAAQVTENGVPPTSQDKVEAPGFKVFAGNLAYSTTEDGLKAFFDPVKDDVLSVQVIMRGQQSAGYGFVALTTEEAAQKAVDALNKQELDGRLVIVEIAKPADQKARRERRFKRRPGRRGGKAVPGEVTEAEANGQGPNVEEATAGASDTPRPKKKKSTRKSKTKTESTTDAEPGAGDGGEGDGVSPEPTPAVKKPRHKFKRRNVRPAGQDPAGEPSKTMLFVANLGFNIEDAGLEALFKDAGIHVNSARIVRRRHAEPGEPRRSKGFGFVDVGSEEEQKKAIECLHGNEVGGRPIAVKIAVNTSSEDNHDGAAPTTNGVTATV